MKLAIKHNLFFLIPTLFFWIVALILLLIYSKQDLHLLLNSFHTQELDLFFKYSTEIGGWVPVITGVAFILYKFRIAILILAAQLLVSIVVQILKYYIKEDRPKLFFEKLKQPLHEIQGVSMHGINSFPSGHTASAFALFLCLCFITQRDWLKFLFFIMAFLAGFSRIYLSQHFTLDVLVGSLIGIVVTYTYAVFHQKIKVSWFDKSLISLVCNKN